jgi:hypothetical protein
VERVDVAASRAVRTGFNQAVSKISDANAEKLHAEYFEVSAHLTARLSHAVWQGKVYSRKQLVEVCGLGTGPGLLGWNCRHSYYPFIPGISKRTYTDEQLEEIEVHRDDGMAREGIHRIRSDTVPTRTGAPDAGAG